MILLSGKYDVIQENFAKLHADYKDDDGLSIRKMVKENALLLYEDCGLELR